MSTPHGVSPRSSLASRPEIASLMGAVATVLSAGSVFWPSAGRPIALWAWTAPLVAVGLFGAQLAMSEYKPRTTVAKWLWALGAAALAVAAYLLRHRAA